MSKQEVFGLDFAGLGDELLDAAAKQGQDYMERITPVGTTGKLKASIGITRLKNARKVGASDPRKYPRIVFLDIKPFKIRPKTKKVLKFMDAGKQPAWAKYVMHPGGQRVISRTEDWLEARLGEITDKVMQHYPKGAAHL